MYKVKWRDNSGHHDSYDANSYEDAIKLAKSKLEYQIGIENYATQVVVTSVINGQNDLEVWKSDDTPELKAYAEMTPEEWNTAERGHHEKSNASSVYFDIDGTLGFWYTDGRGFPIEEIMNPVNHYFRDIEPHRAMILLAENLHNKGVDVCIISAAGKDNIRDKWEWIEQNMPFIPKENICFSPIGADKSQFVKGNAEKSVLIDDYNKNLDKWKGIPVKAINNVNSHQDKYREVNIIKSNEARDKALDEMEKDPFSDEQQVEQYKETIATVYANSILRATELIENTLDFAERMANEATATATEAAYENNDAAIDITCEEYVEGYGDFL